MSHNGYVILLNSLVCFNLKKLFRFTKVSLTQLQMGYAHDIAVDKLEKIATNDLWANSPYKKLVSISVDARGKWGEAYISMLIRGSGIEVEEQGLKKDKSGFIYDFLIEKKDKWEQKTATMGMNETFQHENLSTNKTPCGWFFLDVEPEKIWLTILRRCDLSKKIPDIGKRAHLRKNTNDIYKLDFSKATINKAKESGICINLVEASEEDIRKFLRLHLIDGTCQSNGDQ